MSDSGLFSGALISDSSFFSEASMSSSFSSGSVLTVSADFSGFCKRIIVCRLASSRFKTNHK
jgi:hypothetical protein